MKPDQPDKNGRNRRGQFTAGNCANPKGRPPAMPAELRQRLTDASPEVVDRVIELAREGDMHAARLVLERVAPVTRSTAAPVVIPALQAAQTLTEKAQAIITAVGRGECPPDIGATLIQAVGAVAKIIEIDEIERRLAALEEARQ